MPAPSEAPETRRQILRRHLGPHRTVEGERTSGLSLTGRTVAITGANAGVGKAIAERFAIAGASLVLNGKPERKVQLEELAHTLNSFGVGVEVVTGEIQLPETGVAIARVGRDLFGGLDTLVNNAGITADRPFSGETDRAREKMMITFRGVVEVNLIGTFNTTLGVIEDIRKAPRGRRRIANITSISRRHGNAYQSAYVATKAGIDGLTKAWAIEFAQDGVAVNSAALGPIRTKIWRTAEFAYRRQQTDEQKKLGVDPLLPIAQKMPLLGGQRFITPEEAAHTVLYLISDLALPVTGQILEVEAGVTHLRLG
ncbi:SDR family oxidoreductase [Candidatus Daviesbacteria bacterium]|nr:SDR family oxidoreductase [Candidatus Daviesbacteria bacterium]